MLKYNTKYKKVARNIKYKLKYSVNFIFLIKCILSFDLPN